MTELHHRSVRGETLTEVELQALERYLAECDANEARQLAPAVAHSEQQAWRHAQRIQQREALLAREEALLQHLRQLLDEANAIRREWQQAA